MQDILFFTLTPTAGTDKGCIMQIEGCNTEFSVCVHLLSLQHIQCCFMPGAKESLSPLDYQVSTTLKKKKIPESDFISL